MMLRQQLQAALRAVGVADAVAHAWIDPLTAVCALRAIDRPRRIAAFLAQLAHETAGLTKLEEDLRYRDPARLDALFSAVRGLADAETLIRRGPVAIANRVYGARNGNGSEDSGDGWRYRGRGGLHLTGRANYQDAGADLCLPLEQQPDLVLRPDVAAQTAGWFWIRRGCNEMADKGDIAATTQAVNGAGMAGAEHRAKLYRQALSALSAVATAA